MKAVKSKAALKSTKNGRAGAATRGRAAYRRRRSPTTSNANTSLPVFVFVGALFTGVGFVVLYVFRNSEEVVIDYTRCTSVSNSSQLCGQVVRGQPNSNSNSSAKCWCEVRFQIENDMPEPVFVYYGLVAISQLAGRRQPDRSAPTQKLADEYDGDSAGSSYSSVQALPRVDEPVVWTDSNMTDATNASGKDSYAYAVTTDTLTVFSVDHRMYVRLNRTAVAWPWPDMRCGRCGRLLAASVQKPPPSGASLSELRAANNLVDLLGLENEHFMMWLRPIAASTFRKLHRKTNYSTAFNGSLPKGDYRLLVAYTHPVTVDDDDGGGGKSLIVANSTVLGAKNRLLGVAFVATGCVCLVTSIVIGVIRLRRTIVGKKKA